MGNINYSSLKNSSLWELSLFLSIINQLQKPMYITHSKTIHFVGMDKPKRSSKGLVEAAQLTCKSQQLKLTWAIKLNFSTTWQLGPITLPCQVDFRHFLCDTKLRWHDIKLGSFNQLSSLSSSTHSIKD